ncbi:MAG TPA: hypothetical protein VFK13_03310 [Gemmatimonadaceae bacterium]|nr:hypothetical protein [Gemmatimonadaceae bacterium]
MCADVTETAAQRVERIKRERAPWSIGDDIRRYARQGFGAIPDDDLAVRLRAWGLYTQGDGRGTRGDAVPFFMMRVRTPNGVLTATQVRTIAELSERYGRGVVDITNRQNFQLHWLRIEDVPAIWDALERVGWTSMGACGDNTRTVTGCPVAGVDAREIVDASPLALAVDRHLNGNAEFANLPRKFKISISGCADWCSYPEINDIGVTAVRRGAEIGYRVRVGGGLSTRPHLALPLDAFLREEQVLDVVSAIAAIFRDSDELRRNRAKARMKFLFLAQRWNAERFLAEVERRIGYRLERGGADAPPSGTARDHVGVHAQKQPGLCYAGISIVSGRTSPRELHAAAALAERWGDGTLRTTPTQNIIVLNIPAAHASAFAAEAEDAGLSLGGSPIARGMLACTGSEFCKLALVETKAFSIRLAHELECRVPGFRDAIRIHVAGCPNACGQHWIADVGLQGVRVERDGTTVDGFDLFIGGRVSAGTGSAFARRIGVRAAATDVPAMLERLLRAYLAGRTAGETFRDWCARVGDDAVRATLRGDDAGDPRAREALLCGDVPRVS